MQKNGTEKTKLHRTEPEDVTADDLINILSELTYEESLFSKIMNAKTVGELLDISAGPEELLSYIEAAEELGALEEGMVTHRAMVCERLSRAYPEKTRKHALFM